MATSLDISPTHQHYAVRTQVLPWRPIWRQTETCWCDATRIVHMRTGQSTSWTTR